MLTFEGINVWAVLVAWLVNMMVGAYWYSPAGFADAWKKHTGINIMKIPEKVATRILMFVAASALVQATVLGVIINSLGTSTLADGALVGFVLWLGLTAATTVGTTLYMQKTWKFLWLNSSYFLLVMVVNCVVLATWK